MPFPLAHPAAILPLRRCCPRWFNFPALVTGSLCPDAGYVFGPLHLEKFSHRFLAGSFGFSLPMGLLLVLLFHLVRWPVVQRLPARHRRVLEPLCRRPAGQPWSTALSLLVGAWTHLFLDSITHRDGSLVIRFAVLQKSVMGADSRVLACDLLYAVGTFAGAACVGLAYLNWLERTAEAPGWVFPGFKWVAALMLAVLTLLLSFANHDASSSLGLVSIGILTAMLVIAFFEVSGWARCRAGGHGIRAGAPPAVESNHPL